MARREGLAARSLARIRRKVGLLHCLSRALTTTLTPLARRIWEAERAGPGAGRGGGLGEAGAPLPPSAFPTPCCRCCCLAGVRVTTVVGGRRARRRQVVAFNPGREGGRGGAPWGG